VLREVDLPNLETSRAVSRDERCAKAHSLVAIQMNRQLLARMGLENLHYFRNAQSSAKNFYLVNVSNREVGKLQSLVNWQGHSFNDVVRARFEVTPRQYGPESNLVE